MEHKPVCMKFVHLRSSPSIYSHVTALDQQAVSSQQPEDEEPIILALEQSHTALLLLHDYFEWHERLTHVGSVCVAC